MILKSSKSIAIIFVEHVSKNILRNQLILQGHTQLCNTVKILIIIKSIYISIKLSINIRQLFFYKFLVNNWINLISKNWLLHLLKLKIRIVLSWHIHNSLLNQRYLLRLHHTLLWLHHHSLLWHHHSLLRRVHSLLRHHHSLLRRVHSLLRHHSLLLLVHLLLLKVLLLLVRIHFR